MTNDEEYDRHRDMILHDHKWPVWPYLPLRHLTEQVSGLPRLAIAYYDGEQLMLSVDHSLFDAAGDVLRDGRPAEVDTVLEEWRVD